MEQFFEFFTNHLLLCISWLAVAAMLLSLTLRGAAHSVTPQQLVHMINNDDAVAVDLRPAADFDSGHILGAVNIPQSELESRLGELEKKVEGPVVLCCGQGTIAGRSVNLLQKAGIEKIYQLKGGVAAWQRDNLPLEN